MVLRVVELRLRFVALLVATGLVFGYWDTIRNHLDKWNRPGTEHLAAASDQEFYCPMHPNVVQGEPGSCPICGMPLSKRKPGARETLPEGVTARVSLAPHQVARAGIRMAEVSYAPMTETLTTVGFVELDERRVRRIDSKVPGLSRVERLLVNFSGMPVERGQALAEIYAPELDSAVRELLLSQRRADEAASLRPSARGLVGSDAGERVRLATEKLRRWGITSAQIDTILRTRQAEIRMPILSPIRGFVMTKNVVEGQYVREGEPLFEVAELDQVWVRAKVFEHQIPLLKVGQAAEAAVEAFPGEVFSGRVAFIQPRLDPSSRTLDVRYDLENPDHKLRPGMFATVTLRTPVTELPAFREKLAGAATPIHQLAGLTPEQQKTCPVTTLKLGSMGDPVSLEHEGRKVWFCCEGCEPKFQKVPARYLARLEGPPKDQVLSVPESAVIDTGSSQVVFVESEPGVFEGREVVLGPRSGDRYPVLEGLYPGESVAAAGAFLIDAETRLNPAAAGLDLGGGGQAPRTDAPTRSAATTSQHVH